MAQARPRRCSCCLEETTLAPFSPFRCLFCPFGAFSPPLSFYLFLFTNFSSSPHTSSHMFGHHPATVQLAGRKRHARFESSEALAELPAVARTAVELHGCCARVSLAEALLSQHIDCVARAGRCAGTKSGSSARSLVLLTKMLAPVVENRTVRGSTRARRRSELGNRRPLRHGQLSSPWRSGRRFANFQRQRGPADPRESVFCADAPRSSSYGAPIHLSF
jgi:hypothetical protein